MKVALLINRDNFDKYADWSDTGWELEHLGNAPADAGRIISLGADAIVVDAVVKLGADIIEHMPQLRIIHSQGVAFNAIDLESARAANIYVCNCAGANARPVAEHTVMLILNLIKSFRYNEDMVYANRQMEAKTACFVNGLPELYGRKVGIVGYGAIGSETANILRAFGCALYYYSRTKKDDAGNIKYLPLEELYASCDIISLHVPVTPQTENMINSQTLKLFKQGALLINTSRGELMDHEAVVDALISGRLGGLGADTLAPEPYLPNNPIISTIPPELRGRVALSPHIAGITAGFFTRAYEHIRKNIESVAAGKKPDCIVNGL